MDHTHYVSVDARLGACRQVQVAHVWGGRAGIRVTCFWDGQAGASVMRFQSWRMGEVRILATFCCIYTVWASTYVPFTHGIVNRRV